MRQVQLKNGKEAGAIPEKKPSGQAAGLFDIENETGWVSHIPTGRSHFFGRTGSALGQAQA
jgi:hypothetical protein